MHSKSKESFINKPLSLSLGIHGIVLLLFMILFYLNKSAEKIELSFTVIEKFKVIKKSKPVIINIKQPKIKPKVIQTKRQVYGVSRKGLTDTKGTRAVKRGNTLAKTPDNKILNKDDEDSIPIPADEFLITSMPKVLEEMRPVYPEVAKKKSIEGSVILEIIIDEKGKVRQANIVKSLSKETDQSAKEAMMNFRFKPGKINDKPVPIKIKYTIRFVLEK